MSRVLTLLIIVLAFALRVYALDAKGLSYDEAATALMARATPAEIIAFHWRAAFEHPPIWQLLMHGWSQLAGQSEFALRYLPVLAGVLLLPLLYQLARHPLFPINNSPFTIYHLPFPIPHSPLTIDHLLFLLTALAPILIYYSQEARMYSLVVTAAVAATLALHQLLTVLATQETVAVRANARRAAHWVALVLLLHWFMLGLHYYSLLLVLAEGIGCLIWLLVNRARRHLWFSVAGTFFMVVAPIALWLAFAPGFHDTLRITLADATPKPPTATFFGAFWREVSFASVRWDVPASVWGYLWLPLVAVGVMALLWPVTRLTPGPDNENLLQPVTTTGKQAVGTFPTRRLLGLVVLLVAFLPIVLSALFFPSLATRYLLYVVPFLLLIMAAGVAWLARRYWPVAGLALGIALVVPALALPHYFGPYQKSDYRAMSAYLRDNRQPNEAILLEAPRQHLLAKYYLPADGPLYSAPAIDLPPYWPANAPPVVPEAMDDVIQALLRDYAGIWLSLTAENEVDPGEFVPKYLTAVAFELDCGDWLDVRLCHYRSPHALQADLMRQTQIRFADDLLLEQADLAGPTDTTPALLVTLHWRAPQIPRIDYRVTLRLVDATGGVVSQRDNFPIGPLLPPTTWQAGDEKPGYMALPLPASLATGDYGVTVNLYEATTGDVVSWTTYGEQFENNGGDPIAEPLLLGWLTVGETMKLRGP